MNDAVISRVDQLIPEWLTNVLAQSGALKGGQVRTIGTDTKDRELSTNTRIQVYCSDGANGKLPGRLFLKTVNTDMGDEFFGPSEVHYYTRDYVGIEDVPIPTA